MLCGFAIQRVRFFASRRLKAWSRYQACAQHWISLHAGCNQSLACWLENLHHVHPRIVLLLLKISLNKVSRMQYAMQIAGAADGSMNDEYAKLVSTLGPSL